ncbi:YitT family protein [Lottiidibacillus patelloidae]|uniref:YitT family protein n=1 Tax=Lottiidibacillus patelloidae TaxID=2670334 RepID=UPI0018E9527C|nr:YitT family protein [Lottiidibacillus patelloidae]
MSVLKKGIAIIIGSFLLGIGINGFIVPYHLLDGGMVGIGLIMKYIWGYKVGLTIIILSVPIYLMAWIYYRSYFFNSLHGMLVSAFVIDLLGPLRYSFHLPPLYSALLGGLLVGTGVGLMLRFETSTGGTDLIAQLLTQWISLNVGILIFLIDTVIIMIGGFVFSKEILLYSIITISAVGFATSSMTLKGKEVIQ